MEEAGKTVNMSRKISRRRFIKRTGAAVGVATAAPAVRAQRAQRSATGGRPFDRRTRIALTVNGAAHEIAVEDRWTLAELLRDHLNLTGTKIGCDRGECGACTVLVNGKPVYSCSQLAVWADGKWPSRLRSRRSHASFGEPAQCSAAVVHQS
ncbi:MAG: hypothetical protein AUJ01_13725 [Acidobacteria bacterium 13_1_40CM_3_65_5]|nr:MAG: hypothetical protein AUJ01_13725 [Acidobacteria bacterium 13_1_40CM_3_65_5]